MQYRPQSPLDLGEGLGAELLHLRALHVSRHVALLHEALDVEWQPSAVCWHLFLQFFYLLEQTLIRPEMYKLTFLIIFEKLQGLEVHIKILQHFQNFV